MDRFEWRGNSWCDRVVRGYHTHATRTPVERASVLRCVMLRAAGHSVGKTLGVPTVPPDIFYNPSRLLFLGHDLFRALTAYAAEGWDDRPVDEFFSHLVEQRVDPVLVFNVLAFAQRAFRWGVEVTREANVTGAIERVAGAISPRARDLLHETFELARGVGEAPDFPRTNLTALRWSAAHAAAPVARLAQRVVATGQLRRRLLASYASSGVDVRAARRAPPPPSFEKALARASSAVVAGDGVGACSVGETLIETLNDAWTVMEGHYGAATGFERSRCLFQRFLEGDNRTCTPGQPAREPSFDLGRLRWEPEEEQGFRLPPEVRDYVWPPPLRSAFESIAGKIGRAASRFDEDDARSFAQGFTTCDWKVVSCSVPKRYSFATGAFMTQSIFLGGPVIMATLGANSALVALAAALGQAIAPAVFVYATYGMSPMCLPAVPTCLADDFFEELDRWTPRYIQWPAALVARGGYRTAGQKRLMRGAGVLDCRARGYRDPFDTFAWFLRDAGAKLPAVVRRLAPAFALAEDRRAEHAGEDSWCAVLSTGPYALAALVALTFLVSAALFPLVLFFMSLAPNAVRVIRELGKFVYELK